MSKSKTRFWNSGDARIMAVVLAAVLAVFAALEYYNADQASRSAGAPQLTAAQLPALGNSKAVTECTQKEIANIEQMVKDGYTSTEDAADAKVQAESFCISWVR